MREKLYGPSIQNGLNSRSICMKSPIYSVILQNRKIVAQYNKKNTGPPTILILSINHTNKNQT